MLSFKKTMSLMLMICMCCSTNARKVDHTKHYVWDKKPIEINLPIGKRKIIMFEHNIKLLKSIGGMDVKKLQNTIYIKAQSEFEDRELFVKDEETNEVIVLSLNAKTDVNDIYNVSITSNSSFKSNQSNYASEISKNETVNYLTLTRYVIQTLFKSEESVSMLPGVVRVPMYTKKHVGLVYQSNIVASPIASWHGDELYATAIQLNNLGDQKEILDPRTSLKGSWLTITFYPSNQLQAKGNSASSTTAILTSAKPFNEALYSIKGYVR